MTNNDEKKGIYKPTFVSLILLIGIIYQFGVDKNKLEKKEKHCAEIDYYNPKTRKHSTYTLPVVVENNELVKIYWVNEGWLDESHFEAPNITDGTASFTDDRGREYEVELIDDEDCD